MILIALLTLVVTFVVIMAVALVIMVPKFRSRSYWQRRYAEKHRKMRTLLAEVLEAASQQGISYFMDFGTALGVYRHEGFIPWDDDVDIAVVKTAGPSVPLLDPAVYKVVAVDFGFKVSLVRDPAIFLDVFELERNGELYQSVSSVFRNRHPTYTVMAAEAEHLELRQFDDIQVPVVRNSKAMLSRMYGADALVIGRLTHMHTARNCLEFLCATFFTFVLGGRVDQP